MALLFLSLLGFGSRPVAAQTAEPREVRVVIAADEAEALATEGVVNELLARLGVSAAFSRSGAVSARDVAAAAADPRYLAEVWVDLDAAGQATLFILDARADRLLVRVLPRRAGEGEITREELGHVLETSIEGLLSGAEIGAPRAEALKALEAPSAAPPPPAPPPAPPRDAPPVPPPAAPVPGGRPLALSLGVLYEVERFAPGGHLAHGPLLAFGASVSRGRLRPGGEVTAQYRQPLHSRTDPVGARLEGGALRILGTLAGALGPRVDLVVAAGGGVDLWAVTPETSSPEVFALAEPGWLSVPVARGATSVEWQVARSVRATVGLVADVDPSRTRLVAVRAAGSESVLWPAVVRPGVLFGVQGP